MVAITKVGSATFGITCATPEAKIYEGEAAIAMAGTARVGFAIVS